MESEFGDGRAPSLRRPPVGRGSHDGRLPGFLLAGAEGFEPPHQESCPMGLWLLCGQQIVRRTPQQARARSATLLPMARRITLQITSRQFHLPHP